MGNVVNVSRIQCAQIIAFDMLCHFRDICEKEGYAYSLAGGTLLGAIRNKGFLPWDDDVDVFLLREDYDKFIEKYAGKQQEGTYYRTVDRNNDSPGIVWARMIDTRTHVSHKNNAGIKQIWIDILPVDAIPNKQSERMAFQTKIIKLRNQRVRLIAKPFTGKTLLKKILKTPFAIIGRFFGAHQRVCDKIDIAAQIYRNSDAREVGEIVAQARIKGTINYSTFRQPTKVQFNGQFFNAMPDYNHYLTGQYGNYLLLPEKEKRTAHKLTIKLDLDKFDVTTQEKLLYYIEKKDLEEINDAKLAAYQNIMNMSDEAFETSKLDDYDTLLSIYKGVIGKKDIKNCNELRIMRNKVDERVTRELSYMERHIINS